ncbi:hypothetical protein AHAS_Ahas11G0069900 [Arachis hypogaea]
MSNDKNAIVEELGFATMWHIPAINVPYKLLKELAYSFYLYNSTLDKRYGVIKITPEKIGNALGLNASGECYPNKYVYKEINEEQKEVVESSKGCSLSLLTKSLLDMNAAHVLNFLINGIRVHKLENKFAIDGCLFALMIVYFYESTYKNRPVDRTLGPPWMQYWTRKKLVKRIESEVKDEMSLIRRAQLRDQSKKEKKEKSKKKEATKEEDYYI